MATPRKSTTNKAAASKAAAMLRAKVWVETDRIAGTFLSDAGADLLEQIEVCGSLSEAARRLRYAYRRAWLLVDALNRGWSKPLVTTAAGGKKGGGTQLTAEGRAILAAYRDVQLQIEHALDQASLSFTAATRPHR